MKKSLLVSAAIAAALILAAPIAAMADSTSSDASQVGNGALGTILATIFCWVFGIG